MAKLISITPYDIQSWAGREELHLSPSRVTVLKAASETGKSVITNFLTDFCKMGYEKDVFTSIVRKGSQNGGLVFNYDDDTSLVMVMSSDVKVMGFYVNGEQSEVYYDDEINEISLERFGIIVDNKNGLLLNVLSRNNPLLFVDTDDFFNGALLTRVLVERDVERIQDYLKAQEDKLKDSIKSADLIKGKLSYQESSLEFKDVTGMVIDFEKMNVLREFCNKSYTIERRMEELDSISRVDFFLDIKESEKISDMREVINNFDGISFGVQGLINLALPREITLPDVPITREQLSVLQEIGSISSGLFGLGKVKTLDLKEVQEVQELLVNTKVITSLWLSLGSVASSTLNLNTANRSLAIEEIKLREVKEQLKLCPLCGNQL